MPARVVVAQEGEPWDGVLTDDGEVFGREGMPAVTVGGPGLVAVGAWPSSSAAVWVATTEN